MTCEHAKEKKGLQHGRVCELDGHLCFLFDNSDAVAICPTLADHKRGVKFSSATPASYQSGISKRCFRSGPTGGFDGGMPPNYMRANLLLKRRKK